MAGPFRSACGGRRLPLVLEPFPVAPDSAANFSFDLTLIQGRSCYKLLTLTRSSAAAPRANAGTMPVMGVPLQNMQLRPLLDNFPSPRFKTAGKAAGLGAAMTGTAEGTAETASWTTGTAADIAVAAGAVAVSGAAGISVAIGVAGASNTAGTC